MKTGVQIPAPLVSHTPISLALGDKWRQTCWLTSVTKYMTSRERPCPKRIWYKGTEDDTWLISLFICTQVHTFTYGNGRGGRSQNWLAVNKVNKKMYSNTLLQEVCDIAQLVE